MNTLKRKREADKGEERETRLANMFFVSETKPNPTRVFSCKTCQKEFKTFQALGGHCASHANADVGPKKVKFHQCSICGEKFIKGQALGGHMTKHRKEAASDSSVCTDDVFKRETIVNDRGMELERSNRAEMLLWGMDLKLGLP